jgi:hypothetical protein
MGTVNPHDGQITGIFALGAFDYWPNLDARCSDYATYIGVPHTSGKRYVGVASYCVANPVIPLERQATRSDFQDFIELEQLQ